METFEHLHMSLICWLDGDIANDEKIRKIQRLVTVYNDNGESRFRDLVKADRDCRIMMHSSDEIVLMVLITLVCYLVVVFIYPDVVIFMK